eukprot:jgi/Galph1/5179/GphlegSOOS_G3869.1
MPKQEPLQRFYQWQQQLSDEKQTTNTSKCWCERVEFELEPQVNITELKARANELYQQCRWLEAEEVYSVALERWKEKREQSYENSQYNRREEKQVLQIIYSNRAQTRLMLKKYAEAESDPELHLKGNLNKTLLVKTLLRRASALVKLHRKDEALAVLLQIQGLEPENPEYWKLYAEVTSIFPKGGFIKSQQTKLTNILDSPSSLLSADNMQHPTGMTFSSKTVTENFSSKPLVEELSNYNTDG